MDLPLSVVVDIAFNSAKQLVECSRETRPKAASIIRQFVGAAPQNQRRHIRSALRDAVAHYRFFGGLR
tara:strand:+ start:734 stop:937 length:204 start_codon:yes stop_codon:yes gene_type:complete